MRRGWGHQQPEVNYLPRFSSRLISLERYTLSVYRAGEMDLFENLDIVHVRLLVGGQASVPGACLAVGEKKQNLPAPSLMSVMVVYQRKALAWGTARSRAVDCGRRTSRPFKRRALRGMPNHGLQLGRRPAPRVRRGRRCPWSRAGGLASSRECECREPVPRNLTSDPYTPFLPARSECPLAPNSPPSRMHVQGTNGCRWRVHQKPHSLRSFRGRERPPQPSALRGLFPVCSSREG